MAIVIVFLPLLAAIFVGFFGKKIGDRLSQLVTSSFVGVAALLSILLFLNIGYEHAFYTLNLVKWIDTDSLSIGWSIRIDSLSSTMLVVVTVVSLMVHIYSIGYMSHDHSIPRFMSYLSLFTFAMLMLVTADNFIQMFFGWEGVGVASYLLIGFWYDRPSACSAAMKAFVVNRVGDFGFALGIFATFYLFGTLSFDSIFSHVPEVSDKTIEFLGFNINAITLICLLLFIGAMGKSAQLGLHTWLPDAMEGPTPVSALIHAATMVTAGVFMLCRLSPIFEYSQTALDVITVVGATTSLFAATVGLTQFDIKRVIAYSTCSQLGYMFFAAGVSAYPAAMFHLTTHAFFKALLFLCAGSVIHAMSGEQDMRRMGGIWNKVALTYIFMWVGNLALAGIWPFAGFYSKDLIIDAAFAAGTSVGKYAYWVGIVVAFLTSFYSWRLLFMTFHGQSRADKHVIDHVHESSPVMLAPLFILAIGAVFSGAIGFDWFVGEDQHFFWGDSIHILDSHKSLQNAEDIPWFFSHLALFVGVLGIVCSWVAYVLVPEIPERVVQNFDRLHKTMYNKWYFDELYNAIFVRMASLLGWFFWRGGDGFLIDGMGPDGVVRVTRLVSRRVASIETGFIYHYAFAMFAGLVMMVTYYLSFQS